MSPALGRWRWDAGQAEQRWGEGLGEGGLSGGGRRSRRGSGGGTCGSRDAVLLWSAGCPAPLEMFLECAGLSLSSLFPSTFCFSSPSLKY